MPTYIGLPGKNPIPNLTYTSYRSLHLTRRKIWVSSHHPIRGLDGVPGVVLKHMPPVFHEVLHILFQALAINGITPPSWIKSHIILLYKKRDPTRLDNYHQIILANAIYKLWTTCIVILATDYIESSKILSPEQEGFRVDHSCDRAIAHLGPCVEHARSHKKHSPMLPRH